MLRLPRTIRAGLALAILVSTLALVLATIRGSPLLARGVEVARTRVSTHRGPMAGLETLRRSRARSDVRESRVFAKKTPQELNALAAGGRSGGRVGGAVRPGRSSPGMRRQGGTMGGMAPRPYGGGGPNIYINPYPSPFFSPFFNPFYGGFGGIGFATPLPLNVLALGAFGLLAWRTMRSQAAFLEASTGTVMLLQVAVYCGDRGPNSLYGRLNNLAAGADTWSEEGLRNLVQETTLALLRSEEDWVAGRSETFQKGMLGKSNDVESAFNQALLKERAKFEEENTGRLKRVGANKPSYMIVTVMVALRDAPNLPTIRGLDEMRSALAMTSARASIEENLLAAEVLWTPEDPEDSLTREEVFLKFPELIDL
uniref:Uncharacterized protein n=2 Tax=Lotharella globosa TaxID=91324 RepID=A0A7S3Z195_9EUKA|mmetsp:Transcript_15005/g.28391  ORF Transcript_15005/g.28391 Transcript_15005/m.28391 type:complete len:370 (-) Transcript_15005:282-1391(-)